MPAVPRIIPNQAHWSSHSPRASLPGHPDPRARTAFDVGAPSRQPHPGSRARFKGANGQRHFAGPWRLAGARSGCLYALEGLAPRLGPATYIAGGAHVIGDVELADRCSVWFGAVLRADNGAIRIGARSNIQDGAVIHCLPQGRVELGACVSVGHQAAIHGASIADRCLIGIQAIVLDGARLECDTLVAAGSLVPPGRRFEPGVLVKGRPACAVRRLTSRELDHILANALEYAARAERFARALQRR
jgi:carbonic anhydrase/acetyltransferase-like protein (isoleucine patch superfamily)